MSSYQTNNSFIQLRDFKQNEIFIVWVFLIPLLKLTYAMISQFVRCRKKRWEVDNTHEENSVSMYYVERISLYEFQREGKENTEYHLRQLLQTPEYQQFLKEKEDATKKISIATYTIYSLGVLCAAFYFLSRWNAIKEINSLLDWGVIWSTTNGILLASCLLAVSFNNFAREMSHSPAPKFSSRNWRPLLHVLRRSIGISSSFIVCCYLTLTTVTMYFLHPFVPSTVSQSNIFTMSLLENFFVWIVQFIGKVPLGLFLALFGHHLLKVMAFFGLIFINAVVIHHLCAFVWDLAFASLLPSPHSPFIHFLFVCVWPVAIAVSLSPIIFTQLRQRLSAAHIAYVTLFFVLVATWNILWAQLSQYAIGLWLFGFAIAFLATTIYLFPNLMFKHFVIVICVVTGLHLAQDFLKQADLWNDWRYALLFSFCVLHQHLDPIIKYYQLDEVDEE
jgi:hypothetical protein